MEQYKVRPGIVLAFICKQPVLIPTRAASEYCKKIKPLPYLWAATWAAIEKGISMDETIKVHQIMTKKPEAEVIARIERFCEDMTKKGFMYKEET